MRNIQLTDAEAGQVFDLLKGMRSLPAGQVREIDQYEKEGWPGPLAARKGELIEERRKAQARAEEITDLMNKFLGSS